MHDRLSWKHPVAGFTQIRSVEAAPRHWEGQTKMVKLIGTFPDHANAPKMALDLYMGRYGTIKLIHIFVCLQLRHMDLLQSMSRCSFSPYSVDVQGNR